VANDELIRGGTGFAGGIGASLREDNRKNKDKSEMRGFLRFGMTVIWVGERLAMAREWMVDLRAGVP
jgi:hypothetical protein